MAAAAFLSGPRATGRTGRDSGEEAAGPARSPQTSEPAVIGGLAMLLGTVPNGVPEHVAIGGGVGTAGLGSGSVLLGECSGAQRQRGWDAEGEGRAGRGTLGRGAVAVVRTLGTVRGDAVLGVWRCGGRGTSWRCWPRRRCRRGSITAGRWRWMRWRRRSASPPPAGCRTSARRWRVAGRGSSGVAGVAGARVGRSRRAGGCQSRPPWWVKRGGPPRRATRLSASRQVDSEAVRC